MKIALKDDVWPDGSKIPAGTHCSYLPYAAGRWPGNWGSDCFEFRPERWTEERSDELKGLDEVESKFDNDERRKDFDYKFIAFNAGPRICLGKSMAYMEAKICLALLLPRFKFRLQDGCELDYNISLVLRLKKGLLVSVSLR